MSIIDSMIQQYATKAGVVIAKILDTDGNGHIDSREQVEPLVKALAALSPEQRGEFFRPLNALASSPEFSTLPSKEQQLVRTVVEFGRSLETPAQLARFCGDPKKVQRLSEALNTGRDAIGSTLLTLEQTVPANRAHVTLQELMATTPGLHLGALQPQLGIQHNTVMLTTILNTATLAQVGAAADQFKKGFNEAAPKGLAPIDANDVCHGLSTAAASSMVVTRR